MQIARELFDWYISFMSINTNKDFKRSPCPVANILDLVGDKWTLLIVRDIILGKRTYSDFLASEENIPTNILADRLKKLLSDELIYKKAYQQKPVRYEYLLTDKGNDLKLVMHSMVKWGNKHIKGTYTEEQILAFIEKRSSENG